MFYGLLAGCKGLLSIDLCVCLCICPCSSSGIKRLPFSDDEFASPPSKMAREEEPKKGTKERMCSQGGKLACTHACACVLALSLSLPCDYCCVQNTHMLSAFSDRTKYQCQAGCANMQTIPWPLLHKLFIAFSLPVPKAGCRKGLLEF